MSYKTRTGGLNSKIVIDLVILIRVLQTANTRHSINDTAICTGLSTLRGIKHAIFHATVPGSIGSSFTKLNILFI